MFANAAVLASQSVGDGALDALILAGDHVIVPSVAPVSSLARLLAATLAVPSYATRPVFHVPKTSVHHTVHTVSAACRVQSLATMFLAQGDASRDFYVGINVHRCVARPVRTPSSVNSVAPRTFSLPLWNTPK